MHTTNTILYLKCIFDLPTQNTLLYFTIYYFFKLLSDFHGLTFSTTAKRVKTSSISLVSNSFETKIAVAAATSEGLNSKKSIPALNYFFFSIRSYSKVLLIKHGLVKRIIHLVMSRKRSNELKIDDTEGFCCSQGTFLRK